MKKTFPVNVYGKVFYIDEDAYELLLNYLDQIRSAFTGAEGEEIANDIESRISELFTERITDGAQTIVYADVNRVIEIMGKPSDIGDCAPEDARHDNPQPDNAASCAQPQAEIPTKRLYRNVKNKVLGGVLGGIATYFGWNANILRLLYVLFTILFIPINFVPPVLAYLVAWMIIPAANTPRRVLEQQGNPVTIDNIGQNILSSVPPPYPDDTNQSIGQFINMIMTNIRKFAMTIIGLAGLVGSFVATGFFIYFLVALIAYTFFGDVTLLHPVTYRINNHIGTFIPYVACLSYMMFSLCFIIPALALAWLAASSLFNYKGASKSTILIALAFETIFIVTTIILSMFMKEGLYHYYY